MSDAGRSVNEYVLMHCDEVIAVARNESNSVKIINPNKMPFGLRLNNLNFVDFMDWLNKRADNLQRSYMNKVYMARKIGRNLENILRDSCALSITDKFWINRSDIDMSWDKLQEIRDQNEILINVALSGNTVNLDWQAAMEGTTSLFTTEGQFPKAIRGNTMLKRGGGSEREWIAYVIGDALKLPVQNVILKNSEKPSNSDDVLVEIGLFTNDNISLVHASELFANNPDWSLAIKNEQHHRYFYDKLLNDDMKRDFERVLILNRLISNHDMHEENFGCLYNPETFEIMNVAPSFDHNSSDFDGTMPELDVPEIVISSLKYHEDVIERIKSGELEKALNIVGDWLSEECKICVRSVGNELASKREK